MKVWLTRYVLKDGVIELHEVPDSECYGSGVYIKRDGFVKQMYRWQVEVSTSEEDALVRARKLIEQRAATLRKGLTKLESMSIKIKT